MGVVWKFVKLIPRDAKKMKLIFLAIFVVSVVHVYGDPGDVL